MFTYAVKSKDPRNTLTEVSDGALIGDTVTAEYVTLHKEDEKHVLYKEALRDGETEADRMYLMIGPEGSVKVDANFSVGGAIARARQMAGRREVPQLKAAPPARS